MTSYPTVIAHQSAALTACRPADPKEAVCHLFMPQILPECLLHAGALMENKMEMVPALMELPSE